MSEKLQRDKAYPLADRLPYTVAQNLFRLHGPSCDPITGKVWNRSTPPLGSREGWIRKHVKAVWTGEKRAPKAGEWYLSGSDIEAYRAPNDLGMTFHIAKIVRI